MTKRTALSIQRKNNLPGEVSGRGSDWEVEVANEEEANAWHAVVNNLGGYRCGWGGWVLSPSHVPHTGDYCNVSSSHHY